VSLQHDDRGVSTIIGAVFVFAFLVLALSANQVTVVPAENAQVEFSHNQEVRDDLISARGAIVAASYPQQDGSVTVRLGTQYPSRVFAVNPPPVRGRLTTTALEPIEVENGGGTSKDVCVGSEEGRTLTYTGDYNEFNAPTTVYENTFLYNQQTSDGSTGEALLSGPSIYFDTDGNAGSINLVALRNDYSASGTDSTSVDFVSGTTKSKEISDPTITVPTQLETSAAKDAVKERINERTPSGVSVAVTLDANNDRLELDFSGGDFEVFCTPVGVGGAPPSGAGELPPPTSDSLDGVAFDDANGDGVYQSDEESFDEDELYSLDRSDVDLVIADDVVRTSDNGISIEADSLTIQKGVTIETEQGNSITLKSNGKIDAVDANIIATGGSNGITIGPEQVRDGYVDLSDARIEADGTKKVTNIESSELTVNDTGESPSDESNGGTYIAGGSGELKLASGTYNGTQPEEGTVS
jgi:hypothetical protein